jgi:hypothetical protein
MPDEKIKHRFLFLYNSGHNMNVRLFFEMEY